MNSLVCLAVLCFVLAVNIQADQHNLQIGTLHMSFASGRPVVTCVETDTGEHWDLDQTKTENCFECTCSDANNGILCTGIGYQDGVHPPSGCIKRHLEEYEMGVNETCCYQMVSEDNQAVECGDKVCA